jgi:hypothetical protein
VNATDVLRGTSPAGVRPAVTVGGTLEAAATMTEPVMKEWAEQMNAYVPVAANVHSPTQPGPWTYCGTDVIGPGIVTPTSTLHSVGCGPVWLNSTLWTLLPVG